MKIRLLLIGILLLASPVPAEIGNPADIPNAGRVRIDGKLDDWRRAEWAPLTQTLHGAPAISNAQWSLQWDDEPSVYIAVQYDDAGIILQNAFAGTNAQDCISIFVRGDTGSRPADYSTLQDSAQHYFFGLSADQTNAWKKLANSEPFPAHNPAKVAIKRNGVHLIYEIRVPLYDLFDAGSRRNSETSEVMEDLEIGVDITINDVTSTGYAGTLAENRMPNKEHNADAIALHTLGE